MDTYDHLNIPDLQQAAIEVASFVYNSATHSAMMPRKPLALGLVNGYRVENIPHDQFLLLKFNGNTESV